MSDEPVPAEVDSEEEIPEEHPRYQDLVTRHRIEVGVEKGITHLQGMHAEGRGSAFDYLLGERTIESAREAERAAAAALLLAERPVISVNGNVAALAPRETVELAEVVGAAIEVNLFNRTPERLNAIVSHLREHGAEEVLGLAADASVPGLNHERAKVDREGIFAADVVLVPLEDGDRAEALSKLGKTEIVIDLNPLSRSPQVADIPIVDNLIRALPNVTEHTRSLRNASEAELEAIVEGFDAEAALADAEHVIRTGLR
ncbi:4-phosphopantoate--beta-alanine ligase [Natronorarus salvus]|uniref:4-phosphopantoate--beta-alanine ligase n=1 Tax=Natronorarus salvus TaxID=3117733 RepID=UPI002F262FB3